MQKFVSTLRQVGLNFDDFSCFCRHLTQLTSVRAPKKKNHFFATKYYLRKNRKFWNDFDGTDLIFHIFLNLLFF